MAVSPDSVARDGRPRVFVSYAHGDDRWDAVVLDFATALRKVGGVDADLDKWHLIDGKDWSLFGPKAIEASDFVLLACSSTYKDAWLGRIPRGRKAGAAREAATVRALFDRDRSDFQRRVRIVLLPGATEDDIPLDIRAIVERFPVMSFDLPGLDRLLRVIFRSPELQRPPVAPLAALPSYALPDGAADDRGIASALTARLATIDRQVASADPDEPTAKGPDTSATALLEEQGAAVQAALAAVERSISSSPARQRLVEDYLRAQLYFSAGAYQAAEDRLRQVRAALGTPSADPEDRRLEPCLRTLTKVMLTLNDRMRTRRYAAAPRHRHPQPPDMELDPDTIGDVRTFYEVTRSAMFATPRQRALRAIRTAALLGRHERHAAGLYQRFTAQQAIAAGPLDLGSPSPEGSANGVSTLFHADLHGGSDSLAASVLEALAVAHLELHRVERERSVPVGGILRRRTEDVADDRAHLRRSIVLNTFALAISESLPWIFAASEAERTEVQLSPQDARRALSPPMTVWQARQVTMLAYYRRSHGFRLLGDHERSYNDLRILQRLGRLTRQARKDDELLTEWVDTLDALAEYRIGELYRADHDYAQALEQLCRSHDAVRAIEKRRSPVSKEVAHLEIRLSLGKGKAYFEIGAMKRSLKWHLTAWRWLLSLNAPDPALIADLRKVEAELDRMKHDPVIFKEDLQSMLKEVVEPMCAVELLEDYHARGADILVRISHLLSVLRLEEDTIAAAGVDTSALRCLMRADKLDPHNLLVQSGKLRYEMRRSGSIADLSMPDPMRCWPSGASSVDQVIRAAEHLMLERLHAAGGPTGDGEPAVARALMGHFMTHTDSINLRRAILHKYLMRPRAEDREPWWADAGTDDVDLAGLGVLGESARYLEFVCLRRFGSFTPFMPRPAAVSAVGGGYLIRVARPSPTNRGGHPEMFNIVVDPGEGAVNNLYAMGLSIADLDMVIATHDHPEHLAALDAILSLRRELHRRQRVRPGRPSHADGDRHARARLLILGNRSVVNRYSFLNGDGSHIAQHIADASVLAESLYPPGLTIEELPTQHVDAGGHLASGFVIELSSQHPEGGTAKLAIAFMSDTAIEGLHQDGRLDRPLVERWERALAADVVVAHVSDVPSGELRDLADLPAADDEDPIAVFDQGVKDMASQLPADASQLMHALSLVPPDPDEDPLPVSLLSRGAADGGQQLYLEGLLEVCRRMRAVTPPTDRDARVLVVGELNEQLGSFRGTIAREINARMLGLEPHRHNKPAPPLVAITADIGLRIRLAPAMTSSGAVVGRSTVLCSTCSYNNDRLDSERFHAPQDIYDVCVKGDHEAMHWNCYIHDPGRRVRPKFIEQMGAYNPFAAGGRYHG